MPQNDSVIIATLVCTDTVNSTALIERCGDQRAAEIFTRRDQVTRRLLALTSGREIDRADGFLLLFDRPVDAVRFSLLLHEEIEKLSGQCSEPFSERVGIHLGEVILFQHTEAEVAAGAKPFEVEGMAKHLCARLASLALGGQTLVSQAAFNLARRASIGNREFHDSDASIQWLAHGPYQFQGLDEPVDVFEVGRIGKAPLRAPSDSQKAHRVVPAGAEVTLGWRPSPGQPVPDRTNFILQRRLGHGGFGEVWLARHAKTRDPRVFKFCFYADHLRALKREVILFRVLKEALGSREDIAKVFDWRFETPPYYIELEYAESGDLLEWSEAQGGIGKVPHETRLEIVARAADALAAAHSVGVLHKDVKPSNILVVDTGASVPGVRLTDFGIGLLTDRDLLRQKGITATGLTETAPDNASDTSSGSRSGTHLYRAPELLEGKPPTISSDIYALGVVLYQILAGDLTRVLAPGWERDIPDELLREDIGSCVDRDPQRRPASASHLARQLRTLPARAEERRLLAARELEAAKAIEALQRARRRRKVLVSGAVLGLAALLAAISLAIFERSRARRESDLRRQAQMNHARAEQMYQDAASARNEAEASKSLAQLARHKAEYESYWSTIRLASASLSSGDDMPADLRASLADAPRQFRDWEHRFLVQWSNPPLVRFPCKTPVAGGFPPVFSPDGTTVMLIAPSGEAVGYDIATGKQAFRLPSHSPVVTASFSPDGNSILTTHASGTASLWETRSAALRCAIHLPDSASLSDISPLAAAEDRASTASSGCIGVLGVFTPDGSHVCLTECDGSIGLFDSEKGNFVRRVKISDTPIRDLAISPDKQRAIVLLAVENSPPQVHDLQEGRLLGQLTTSRAPGNATDMAHSCKINAVTGDAVAAYNSTYVLIWNTITAAVKRSIGAHAGIVRSATFSGDGRKLISGSNDGSAILWDVDTGTHERTLCTTTTAIEAVNLNYDGSRAITVMAGAAEIWRCEPPTTFSMFRISDQRVRRVRFSSEAAIAAIACGDGTIRIWDFSAQKELYRIWSHRGDVMDARFSADRKWIASAADDYSVRVWDASTGRQVSQLLGHNKIVNTVAFSPDGKLVASASSDGSACLWDWNNQTTVSRVIDPEIRLPAGIWGLRTIDFLDQEKTLISRYIPPGVIVWNWKDNSLKDVTLPIGSLPAAIASRKQNQLVCASRNNAVYVYPLDTAIASADSGSSAPRPQQVLHGHRGYVQDVSFSGGERRVASVGQDGQVRVWDPTSGRCMLVLEVPDGKKCWNVEFSADGRFLVGGTNTGELLVWDSGARRPE